MATFVLVHGAWQGASTWDPVVPLLQAAGHRVLAPALRGLGARRHELSADVKLEQHIRDVIEVFEYEQLTGAVLVGHSYGGMIVTGVAAQVGPRLKSLVYLDGFVPKDGDSTLDLMPEPVRNRFRNLAQQNGGWLLPGDDGLLDVWAVQGEAHRAFVRSKLCDFSIRCFEGKVALPKRPSDSLRRGYLSCVADGYALKAAFAPFVERAKAEGGWALREMPTGHDCHVEMPRETADFLLSLA